MKSDDFFWLVGLIEGEGTFWGGWDVRGERWRSPRIEMSSIDRDIVDRVFSLLNAVSVREQRFKEPSRKPLYKTAVYGERAVDLMIKMEPHMSTRRRNQIAKALSGWTGEIKRRSDRRFSDAEVRRIRLLNENGIGHHRLSKWFGANPGTVNALLRGRTYRDVI